METINQSYPSLHFGIERKKSVVHRFFAWCENQQEKRLLWLAVIITGHACLLTPLTLLFIMLTGNNTIFWPFAIAAMTMALVTNLAALPTKITIPVFILSILIDLAIIANCLALGFSLPATV
jgi:hypothetical protein